MKGFSLESNELYRRISSHAKKCCNKDYLDYSSLDFYQLCTFLEYIDFREYGGGERFTNSGSKEKIALKYFLSKTIANETPEDDQIPDLYTEFVKQLKNTDVIITFNWDILLERAIQAIGKTYSYIGNGNRETDINIYKLHGSINWRLDKHFLGKQCLNWKPLGFKTNMIKNEVYYSDELLYKNAWEKFSLFTEVEPFIILPGFGKGFDVRFLSPLWYKPEYAFAFATEVYIIGCSLAADDFFIRSFFIDNLMALGKNKKELHKILIIDPDKSVREKYLPICNMEITEFINEKFSKEHIS